MTLSDNELTALRNLADKQAGETVDWINISDARALTELGLARRNRGGWEITDEGLSHVKSQAAADRLKLAPQAPTPLRRPPPSNGDA
jgi:hypothetical protein